MPIPNADEAIIEPAKLRDYLLSREHHIGRSKAAFFGSLGYQRERWRQLEDDLRGQHLAAEPDSEDAGEHGRKYVIRAPLTGPNGATGMLVSVWIVRRNEDVPRLVTAYPGG